MYMIIKARYKVFIVTFLIGFINHGYIIVNLIPNHDVVYYFFGYGEDLPSSRWGLYIISQFSEPYNIPWINGILTLGLFSVSVLFILDIFNINNIFLQYFTGGLIISFPALTDTFSFMFTSACYGIAFLLSILAVFFVSKNNKVNSAIAVVCLVLSLSIYQPYLFVTSSLLIVYMMKCILENNKNILKNFLKYILYLFISVAFYFIINFLFMKAYNIQFNDYSVQQLNHSWNLLYFKKRIPLAYKNFILEIIKGYGAIIHSKLSAVIHMIMIALGMILSIIILKNQKKNILLFFGFMFLLPISINGVNIVAPGEIKGRTIYSFIAIYILFIIIIQKSENINITHILKKPKIKLSSISCIIMSSIILFSIKYSNVMYIQLEMAVKNTYSFYTSLVTQIKSNPDFNEDTKIAIIGKTNNNIWQMDEFYNIRISGTMRSRRLINMYSREKYIKYFIGFDVKFATDEEKEIIQELPEFKEMSYYPYYNSMKTIDDYIVIKFNDAEE